ncbi:MAG: hypothetical protein CSH36_04775 [Thalassolituus sp.]|nr:MAG: hypothetical protein CSH36_04775 [Thalassolituus sp.]
MYLEYFGLQRLPFTISPDPEFLYPSQGHQEALAHLSYALTDQGGLICLTGEVGTGKTTLCRALIESVPDGDHVAYIFNPQLSPVELLQSICDELGIEYSENSSLKELYADLNLGLLRCFSKHQRVICVIDEAQSMPAPLLEQIRLLTNLETHRDKLLTLVLVGQPELRDLLARYDLRQLNQRITARYHLDHLSADDTASYLEHRIVCAGGDSMLFDRASVKIIHKASGGVPRLINSIADRALLGAYATGAAQVSAAIARQAVEEVIGKPSQRLASGRRSKSVALAGSVGALGVLVCVALALLLFRSPVPVPSSDSTLSDGALSDSVADGAQNPLNLLSQSLGMDVESCSDLLQSQYRCLWVDWPLTELKDLEQPVAVPVARGSWRVLSPDISVATGDALVLWQVPPGYEDTVKPGDKAAIIRWVRSRLGINWNQEWTSIGPGGVQFQADPEFYDPLLEQAVAEFQISHGLKADRIIGPRTLMHMQRGG